MQQQTNSGQNTPQANPSQPKESWATEYYTAVKAGFARVWANKYLWFWGIFLPASGASFGSGNSGSDDSDQSDQAVDNFFENANGFFFEHIWWFVLGFVAFLLVFVLFWILSAIARNGVIQALEALQNPKGGAVFDFKRVWHLGKESFGQIILIDVLIGLFMLIVLLVLAAPIVLTFAQGKMVGGILLVILALVIVIPLSLLCAFLKQVGTVVAVLSKSPAFKSIEAAYFHVRGNIKESLKMLLTTVILGFVQGLAAAVVIIPVVVVAVGISLLIAGFSGGEFFADILSKPVLLAVIGISLLAFLVFFLLYKSICSLWSQDLWLWWTKKIGSVRMEKEEVESPAADVLESEALSGVKEANVRQADKNIK